MIEQFAASAACDVPSARDSVQKNSVKNPLMSRLSINQVTTNRWTFPEDLNAYRNEGFQAAGLLLSKIGQFGEKHSVDVVRHLELAVSSLSWVGGFTGAHQASFDDSVNEAKDALELAGALGAECLVLISGPQVGHIRSHARRLVIDALKALAEDAAEQGVTLALLPLQHDFARHWSFLSSLDETLEIIARSGGTAQIAFDAYHLWQEPRLLERIPEIAPSVALVQLSDGCGAPRSEHDRCLPGDGEIPLASIVRAFDAAGYAGYYELAIWSEELWQSEDPELLRECRSRFDLLCGHPALLSVTRQ